MDRSETLYDVDEGVAVLTLNRPEIRNALTGQQILDEIISTIETADTSEDVTVLIITGAGSAFSAGGNVKDMDSGSGLFAGDTGTIAEGYRRTIQRLTSTIAETDLVTIAAVNGPAIGAGFDLVLGCDLRIGSTNARFAHTFADLGILPGDGGAWILPRVVGWQRAAELAFTARMVGADEAAAIDVLLLHLSAGIAGRRNRRLGHGTVSRVRVVDIQIRLDGSAVDFFQFGIGDLALFRHDFSFLVWFPRRSTPPD